MYQTKDKVEIFNNKYQQIKSLGQGAYAEVFACRYIGQQEKQHQVPSFTLDRLYQESKEKPKAGELFAIKKFKDNGQNRLGLSMDNIREIRFMQQFNHPNIVKIVDVFIVQNENSQNEKQSNLMIVMPLCVPIHKLLELKRIDSFKEEDFKCMFKQILQGVKYLHENYILHRDIKWENLLIDKDRKIVITDFGLSREFGSTERIFTTNMFTANYRPPEIILGSAKYGPKSDMWAIGVVFMEILMKFEKFLFPITSDNNVEILNCIFALRGTPDQETWKDYDQLPLKIKFNPVQAKKLKNLDVLQGYSDGLVDVLERLLQLNPNKRPTAAEVINQIYKQENKQTIFSYQKINISRMHPQKLNNMNQQLEFFYKNSKINQNENAYKYQSFNQKNKQASLLSIDRQIIHLVISLFSNIQQIIKTLSNFNKQSVNKQINKYFFHYFNLKIKVYLSSYNNKLSFLSNKLNYQFGFKYFLCLFLKILFLYLVEKSIL
ncbi:Serine/Threonine kinase domain protein (macronuclear) [Tetrahymena thermophila SB210]|uniref:Cyclin-dependent kinase 2 homolog n=1 Tax=Tetrahymena thermophila (strain SB210) TaxID=312017 RepID=I7M6V9_TETTS|nr:Serine/Threonine kinase domain protein [Tetrahymena thermophila SB210]EAR87355.3 Serine/Threonine kinase domain protein [Tetrahymena thermophila SB210]|eukprot:XP_001007600.3 Serine/Threonine kinase domain protein [Tetrahymena thermophila SB210]